MTLFSYFRNVSHMHSFWAPHHVLGWITNVASLSKRGNTFRETKWHAQIVYVLVTLEPSLDHTYLSQIQNSREGDLKSKLQIYQLTWLLSTQLLLFPETNTLTWYCFLVPSEGLSHRICQSASVCVISFGLTASLESTQHEQNIPHQSGVWMRMSPTVSGIGKLSHQLVALFGCV